MPDKTLKIVVLGYGGAGKTSLLITYTSNKFPDEYVPTVYDNNSVIQPMNEGDGAIDGSYELGLWDTGGGEDYDRLRPLSYPYTDVFLLCFPVNSRRMFEEVREYWKPEIKRFNPNTPFMVVAMKTDLRTEPKVSESGEPTEERTPIVGEKAGHLIMEDEGRKEAKSLGAADYVECSSLLGEGVADVFKAAIKVALRFPVDDENKKDKCCTVL